MSAERAGMVSVLVVDDDDQIRQVVKDVLDIDGEYEVATASDGDAGIVAIDEFSPEIVLLDMLMVPSDGFTVLRHLQEHRRGRRPGRVIAMSGMNDKSTVDRIMSLGADAVLPKPFTLDELICACRQARQDLDADGRS